MSSNAMAFRPHDEAQAHRLEMTALVLGLSISATLRLAVDELYEQHAAEIAAFAPQYETAQQALEQALEQARQAAKDLHS